MSHKRSLNASWFPNLADAILLRVAMFKDGFTLSLPNLDLEVAEQCSGIRSEGEGRIK